MSKHRMGIYEKYIKRFLDFLLTLIALVILSPLMLIVAFLVRVKLGSPVIFTQPRPGKDEKIFNMYKFRSMTNEKDANGNLLPDEIRLTRFGEKLRSSSLDELPELFNILKGDMSIVGPRPQLVRDMVFMTPAQRSRHEVRQGLTGLAQVNGRNGITWEEKLAFDIDYIENISFFNDIIILLKTVGNVLRKDGINMEGMATAEDYGDYLLRKGRVTECQYSEKQRLARAMIESWSKSKQEKRHKV